MFLISALVVVAAEIKAGGYSYLVSKEIDFRIF
jgi:hypothetical protein